MPARLFLRPQPRAYFLLSDTHALVFRQPAATESKATRSVVVAEFLPLSEVDTKGLVPVGSGRVEGVLGVTSVPSGEYKTGHTTRSCVVLCSWGAHERRLPLPAPPPCHKGLIPNLTHD
jgi:hypothetical protein